MAKVSQEPPSPVDAYEAPPTPFAAGEAAPPAPAGVPRAAAISNGAPAELNVLAVIALIASCFGLTIPGIVMGHIALSQINKSGESGHGLALAAVIVGYALTVLAIIAVAVFLLFLFAIISVAGSAVSDAGTFG
jgi:Domain of unknown function (DUF4190)